MTTGDGRGFPDFLRTAVALGVLAAGAVLSLISASGVGYSESQGADRLREVAPALAASVLMGLTTVAVVLALLRRRVLSPWLGVGALPAAALSLNHTGVLG